MRREVDTARDQGLMFVVFRFPIGGDHLQEQDGGGQLQATPRDRINIVRQGSVEGSRASKNSRIALSSSLSISE